MNNKKEIYDAISKLSPLTRIVFWTIHNHGATNPKDVIKYIFKDYWTDSRQIFSNEVVFDNEPNLYIAHPTNIGSCVRSLSKRLLIGYERGEEDYTYCSAFYDTKIDISMSEYYSLFEELSDTDKEQIDYNLLQTHYSNDHIFNLSEGRDSFQKGDKVICHFNGHKVKISGKILNGYYSGIIIKKKRTFALIEFDDEQAGQWDVRFSCLKQVA